MRGYGSLIVTLTAFITGAAMLRAAEVPDDTAPEMKVKNRKLVFKADPKGLDWAARGSLTKTTTGRWIATYTLAAKHARSVPRYVVVHTSDDEGRTWSKRNCLPDGTPVKGAPLRAENEQVEPCDGGVLTCPNGDLLYVSMTKDHDGQQNYQMRTLQWRSTDNGASWKYEGRTSGIPAGETFALGKTVEGGSIYVTVRGFPADEKDKTPWQVMLYGSDDNARTWHKVSAYGTMGDRINETGVVCVDENTIMVVCRSDNEKTTKLRISRDRGKTWGPMTDITKYVHVVQQPKLTKFPEEPGRIYLTGRDRILEYKQRNCLWYTEDCGKTWKMKPVDDAYFRDSGYGEILKRKNGDLYYLGYRGTDDAADSWEFVLESDYKVDPAANRFLLLDGRLIEKVENARLAVGTVKKHPANPLVGQELPWERDISHMYPNVVYDRQEEIYKIWYYTRILEWKRDVTPGPLAPKESDRGNCATPYPTSKNGIRWEKPGLDVYRYKGEPTNIVVWRDCGTGVFGDPRDPEPQRTDNRNEIPSKPISVPPAGRPPTKEMTMAKRYLNFPIKNDKAKCEMSLTMGGKVVGQFDVALAEDKPDWWAFIDVARFKGKRITIAITPPPKDWNAIAQDDVIEGAEDLYQEKYRPQFHFTSRRGWLNDPNGLIYYKGEYHLFYQYNPFATHWGNMSWGHAVSKDLVHWEELPPVLFPNATGDCFSGAACVDRKNQLGRKTGDEDVLVAFYLRTKIGLCLAYSNDRGRTFTDYEGNPVLTHPGARIDTPRPLWHEPTQRWIAPTYDHFKNDRGKLLRAVGFYSSEDLKNWKFESRVEQDRWGDELCGCVDFFQLPVDGDARAKKWVMIFIDGSYIVGTFDGHVFRTLSGKPAATADRIRSLVVPGNYYATMTWENEPSGRRVQITWMRGGRYPGMPFNQQMTVPAELTLHSTEDGPRLRINPVKELETLRTKTHAWKDLVLKADENPFAGLQGDLFDMEVEFEPAAGTETVFDLRGIKVVYDAETQTLSCGNVKTLLKPEKKAIHLRILLDRTSIEVFGNHGCVYLPICVIPEDGNRSVAARCDKGQVKARFLRMHELKSAWHAPTWWERR